MTLPYCSLLETAGVETGFITTPGLIYSCFNTKVQSQHYKSLHPERGMTLNVNGELWVAVEITLIGKADFLEAWRRGIEEWTRYESDPDKRGLYMTRKIQELYRPIGLKENDLGLQYGSRDRFVQSFGRDMGKIMHILVSEYREKAAKNEHKEEWNRLGIFYGKFGQYTDAEDAFKKALLIDPEYVHAQVNLGSLMYLKGEYNAALIQFRDALSKLEKGGKAKSLDTVEVLLNLSKTYDALKLYDESNKYYELAYAISPGQTEMYAYLGKTKLAETRASEGFVSEKDIFFMDYSEGDIRLKAKRY